MATSEAPADGAVTPKSKRTPAARPRGSPRTLAASPMLAYVLHQYNWSESSLIVELFTRQLGRVVVVAKGAKKPTSNFRPMLLPFLPLQVMLGKTPSDESAEVMNLRSAEWVGGVPLLQPQAMLSGFYLSELLMRLLARQDPHPALFDAFAQTLVALGLANDDAAVLRAFELQLLRELGLLPELSMVTLTAQAVQAGLNYTLHPENGLQRSHDAGAPGAVWQAADAALTQGNISALQVACAPAAQALRAPLRALLHYHLGAKPLRTRQVWQGVQRLAEIS